MGSWWACKWGPDSTKLAMIGHNIVFFDTHPPAALFVLEPTPANFPHPSFRYGSKISCAMSHNDCWLDGSWDLTGWAGPSTIAFTFVRLISGANPLN